MPVIEKRKRRGRNPKEYVKFCDFEGCCCNKVFENKYQRRDHINSFKEKMKRTVQQERDVKAKEISDAVRKQIMFFHQGTETSFDLSSVEVFNNHSIEEIETIIQPVLEDIVKEHKLAQKPIVDAVLKDIDQYYKDDEVMMRFYNELKAVVEPFGISSSSVVDDSSSSHMSSAPSSPGYNSNSKVVTINMPTFKKTITDLDVMSATFEADIARKKAEILELENKQRAVFAEKQRRDHIRLVLTKDQSLIYLDRVRVAKRQKTVKTASQSFYDVY